MNSTLHNQQPSPRLRGVAMVGLIASLFCAAPAFADVVNFETLPTTTNESGTTVTESGFNMLFVEGPVAAEFGLVSGIGTIIDANNPFACDVIACPSGGTGKYLAVLNDGAVKFTHPGELNGFTLSGFDFAFVPPVAVGPGDYGQLKLTGTNWFGTTISTSLDFPGQDRAGSFMFGAASIDAAFRSTIFTSLTFSACIYDFDDVCSNSFDSPAFNQAQFAIDNLTLTAVPEPASFLLFGLGIGALALSRRRAARKAISSTSI